MSAREAGGDVLALRPDVIHEPSSEHGTIEDALDAIEDAAIEFKVLYVDVELQLALARHLAAIVGSIRLDGDLTIAQMYAVRELRLTLTELRQLVNDYATHRK